VDHPEDRLPAEQLAHALILRGRGQGRAYGISFDSTWGGLSEVEFAS